MKNKTWFFMVVVVAWLLPGTLGTPAHAQGVLYVTPTPSGLADCSSWSNACVLQVATAAALSGDEIWLAEGVHIPTVYGDRTVSFGLYDGVAWYGGFAGAPGTEGDFDSRDPAVYPTVLSGDIYTPGVNTDNAYHVVRATGVGATAILDGLTITGGYADGTNPHERGGGMLNLNSSPTLVDCRIEGNHASYGGGGMYNSNSSPTLSRVTFASNFAGSAGGGMQCGFASNPSLTGGAFDGNTSGALGGGMHIEGGSAPTLINVAFTGNTSSVNGGGITSYNSSPTLVGVTFTTNATGSGGGGGIFGWGSGNLDLTDVTFSGNYAHSGGSGGALDVSVTTFALTDVTLDGNYTDGAGRGGAMVMFGGVGTMSNVSFLNNYTGPGSGGGAVWLDSGALTATACHFEGNSSDAGGALYNDEATVTLLDSSLIGNVASDQGGGIWNDNTGSVTLWNCTLAGNRAGDGGGAYNTGSLILVNSTVSENTAERDGGGILTMQTGGPDAVTYLFNVTVTGNVADELDANAGDGGGLRYVDSAPFVRNSIIAGNLDNTSSGTEAPDCSISGSPGVATVTYNLMGDNRGCPAFTDGVNGNIVGTEPASIEPLLGQLADNGGPTPTHALLEDSLARDAGDLAGCQDLYGLPIPDDQRGMLRPLDGDGDDDARCDMGAFEAGGANTSWNRAMDLSLVAGEVITRSQWIDALGQSRWYKFEVLPGSRVTVELDPGDTNLDLALFGDIQAAYDALQAPANTGDLVLLNAEFTADAFSPFAYSPFAYSPFAYSPFAYSPFAYSPFAYSPFAYSPFAYSPLAYSPFAYSPFAYSPFAYSPFAYSPFAYSPFAYSPFAYSPFAYSPDPAYSSAQMQALMAVSAFEGTASELIEVNTWDNRGEFYVRVSGRNGAFDLSEPFVLGVTLDLGICEGVDLITRPDSPTAPDGDYRALFLTDWSRFDPAEPDLGDLQTQLEAFAAEVGGTVVDVGQDAYVLAANAGADAAPQCPYAKNQVAWLIKEIVTAYREAGNPLEYVVLVGNDDVIPFFRYPDRAEIGSEKDYEPPVREGTPSYASLTLGYVLSQDAYGSTLDLALASGSLPIPDLAVGRLVETPADILNMLDVYTLHGGSLQPTSALVSGYDFLEDAALAIKDELEAGIGAPAASLITPDAISPQDREGTPPLDAPWPAEMLRDLLLGARHDLIFLAGHFTAQGALAADYETRLWASELAAPAVDLENALVYSAGCHSGYNLVNEHGVPYVTVEPDWAQAFAQAGATFIGGTGYQYGDTDFLEYSERLYLEFTRELRCGAQPMSVGQALVEAKQAYLAGTAQMRGIHEKALLEATLFGLPMLAVDGLSDAGCPVDPPSEVTSTESYVSEPGDPPTPGQVLGLRYADVTATSNVTVNTVPLRSVVDGETYLDVTYLSGTDGAVTSPAEPVLPLERRNVDVPGYVLRGVGFRGGRFTDLPGMIPLTGAATTETRAAHTPFESAVPYPLQPWSVNYFAELADPGNGITWLDVTPAQFVSDGDGDLWTGTWRRFHDMGFRLFYSNHTAILDAGAVPSLAAPPAILQVLATSGTDEVHFQVHVAGDLAAGIQEVWVTYTGLLCEGGVPCWQSRDLAQSADDSTLWEGTLALNGTPSAVIGYMVQAVNGVGLVSLVTNEGAYFQVDVDPADPAEPAAGGEPTQPPGSTSVEFQAPPSSGAYSTEAAFSAVLQTSGGTPIEGQRLTFALGAQQRMVVTGSAGSATATFPLHGAPGEYNVSATYAGSTGHLRSSATSPFTILKQDAALTFLEDPGVAQYSDDALMMAELTDADGSTLGERTVLFLVSGGGQSFAVSGITDFLGQAPPSHVPLPMGGYAIEAHFGRAVTVNGQLVDLTDANYAGASASGALLVWPEDATVTYTGETVVPEGSTTLSLAATVSQANDGAPGDLSLAWVRFEVRDLAGNWIADKQAPAAGDGTVVATLTGLQSGTYQVDVAVFGGYFASETAPLVAGLSLPLDPVEVDSTVSGSAYFIDADSPLGHTAIWDWGDGGTCDTSVGGECALTEPSGSTPGEVTGNHLYAEPGVYTVRLTVTDGDDNMAESTYEFVVVYSLEGGTGFVTGGGWIWSQAGWCQLDDACAAGSGKANFGFLSRYKKGANAPTGTTEFNFSAGGLNFHSDSYLWLVVNQAGTNAQFKGSGIVNGGASPGGDLYKFMIWAGDGDPDGDDTYRIKIWWQNGDYEVTVYDNGFDQAIGGGSIVIHK